MKSQLHNSLIVLVLLALSTLYFEISTALAQGTAFTYSGQLQTGGGPANGTYNLTFTLFDTNTSGVAITQVVTNNGVSVSNGLFTVQIDFGAGVFTGATNWLEIGVEASGSPTFTTLTPRQQVTPAPNAIYATTAGNFNGNVSASQLPSTVVITGESGVTLISATVNGTISGNGSGILSLNGAQVDSVGNGNPLPSGPGSPPTFSAGNFFVGPSGNATTIGSQNTAIGSNSLTANTNGSDNTAIGFNALYAGTNGSDNTAVGNDALYSNNGNDNTATGSGALLDNTTGSENTANGYIALYLNTSGSDNTATGSWALINNTTGSDNTAIGYSALYDNTSGSGNTAIGFNALYATSGSYNIALGYGAGFYARFGSSNIDIGNQGSLATETENNIIRIGSGQTTAYIAGVITGDGSGLSNLTLNAAQLTSIGNADGGSGNFFVGPSGNSITTGSDDTALGFQTLLNNTSGSGDTAIGVAALNENTSGSDNTAIGVGALLANTGAGANVNTAIGSYALARITDGSNNIALGYEAGDGFVGNESGNIDIGNLGNAGDNNVIRIGTPGIQTNTFIAGVITNTNLLAIHAGAEMDLTANKDMDAQAEGDMNLTANNNMDALAKGDMNLTADNNMTADVGAAMSISVGTTMELQSTGTMQIQSASSLTLVGSQLALNVPVNMNGGNVGIGTTNPTALLQVGSATCNGTTWMNASDRNSKENFALVNPRTVLEKVAALPITEWKYKAEPAGTEHLGPMAQDFHAAFGLNGTDDKHIATVDEQGVALAAIQGLNQKLEQAVKAKDGEIQTLKKQNDSLTARLNELEAMMRQLAARK